MQLKARPQPQPTLSSGDCSEITLSLQNQPVYEPAKGGRLRLPAPVCSS